MLRLQRDIAIGFVVLLAVAAALVATNALRWADHAVYDVQMRWLRAHAPSTQVNDVVVIGLDEAAYESIPEPSALWHRYLGELFVGLAAARPAVVGVATPMPVRSYEFLIKGIDAPLLDGVRRMRAVAPVVIGQPMGIGRQLRPIAPELLAAAGEGAAASLALCEDADGTVRRLNQGRCSDEAHSAVFAQSMARALGKEGAVGGLIDYSAGGEIEYVPFKTALDWVRQGKLEQLTARVQGRAVVVASLLPTEARYRLPVALAAWERGSRNEPGVVAQVQALRSLLGRGLVEQVPATVGGLLAALATVMWFGKNGWRKSVVMVGVVCLILAGSTVVLWQGVYLRSGILLTIVLLAFAARLGWESIRHYREKQLLRTAFAGHVSPQVMRAILGGRVQPDGAGDRCQATILFADIRGFTTRSENMTPEATIALLNRYYAEMSAAIHGRGGAIDKFIGDGVMATFGVPQPLPAPQRNAVEAAQDMLVRIDRLNAQLAREGQEPLEIGIGIQCGEVLAGYVGSRKRRDFTVIGDTVNTASRLESLSKTLGYPVICSHDVAASLGFTGGLVDLGVQAVKGRSALHLFGWSPPVPRHPQKARA